MRGALSLLTVVGGPSNPDRHDVDWFPVVGLAVGGIVGGVWWLAAEAFPPLAAAVAAVAADAVITGMLHLDGTADCGDGLIAPMDRQRRLDAMADPHLGSFGAITLMLVVLARVALLAAVTPHPAVLAAIWCASRTAMAVTIRSVPYARLGGLAEPLRGGPAARVALIGLILAGTTAWLGDGAAAVGGTAAAFGGFAAVVWWAHRRLGGYTGDVLGGAGVAAETIGLGLWVGVGS